MIDRHIPLALLIGLMVQTGGVVWWAATLSTRVDALEKLIVTSTDERYRATQAKADFALRDQRIDTNLVRIGEVQEVIYRIDSKVDRLLQRGAVNGTPE